MESLISAMGAKNPSLPLLFACRAWQIAGGDKKYRIRASAQFGADLLLDGNDPDRSPMIMAYVLLPHVTFAGWADPAKVKHPHRVPVADLEPIHLFLPHTWQC